MYHLLRQYHRPQPRPITSEDIGKRVRSGIYRGLICSLCGHMTDERDCFCGQCGHYLNSVVDEAIADAIAIWQKIERSRQARRSKNEPGAGDDSTRLEIAESYIREQSALYRHYCIPEIRRVVKQFTHVDVTRYEAIAIVQKIRDEKRLGPIADYNL